MLGLPSIVRHCTGQFVEKLLPILWPISPCFVLPTIFKCTVKTTAAALHSIEKPIEGKPASKRMGGK